MEVFMENLSTITKEKYNLQDIPDIMHIPFHSDDEWHEVRKKTIGGSEVGTLLGLNPYETKLDLYKKKQPEFKPQPPNANMRKGTALEKYVMENYVTDFFKNLGYFVEKPELIFVRSGTPWLAANLDGLAVPDVKTSSKTNIVAEIKYVSEWGEVNWDQTEEYAGVPPYYYAQVQMYMYMVNAEQAYIFALFDSSWEVKPFHIKRNEAFIHNMLKEAENFYNIHLVLNIPPKPSVKGDPEDFAEAISALTTPSAPTKHSSEYDDILATYKALQSSKKDLEFEIAKLLDKIGAYYVDGYVPTNGMRVTMTPVTTSNIDAAKVRTLYPAVAAECVKHSQYVRTIVK
jgi:putative phage-type endonuclease